AVVSCFVLLGFGGYVKCAHGLSIERTSVSSMGVQGLSPSQSPSLSADARFVAFLSYSSNLVPNDQGSIDIFVRDRSAGTTERVSVDSAGHQANADSFTNGTTHISADGRYVAFLSKASDLVAGDNNGKVDVFVHDRSTGTTERVSLDSAGNEANGDSDFFGT